jgi:hypothetical protein
MRHVLLTLALAVFLVPMPAPRAFMQAVFDTSCESTLTQSVASHGCTLGAAAGADGILVITANVNPSVGGTDNFTGVTTDAGNTLTAVASCTGTDTASEPGSVKAWFLGTGVVGGSQIVTAARTNNGDPGYMVALSVTAGGDTEAHACAAVEALAGGAITPSEQNVDDGSPGTASLRIAALFYGITTGVAGANSTSVQTAATASQMVLVVRETATGQGSRPVGFSNGTAADDLGAIYLAIRQSGGAAAPSAGLLLRRVGGLSW